MWTAYPIRKTLKPNIIKGISRNPNLISDQKISYATEKQGTAIRRRRITLPIEERERELQVM